LIESATLAAPGYADAHNNLGNVLRSAGRFEEAEASYRRALALHPADANARCNLGATLGLRGDLAAAESECRRALELDPRHTGAYTNLGNVLKRQGRVRESIGAYRAAVAYDPTHPEAPKLLGIALCADGRVDEAREVYRRWVERDPGNPVAAHLLAAISGCEPPARASDGYVRSVFDNMADSFDEHLAHLEYRAPRLVAGVLERLLGAPQRNLRVLDAGCGTGLCASFLRPYAHRLVGVDLSAAMLRLAARLDLYDELLEAELTGHLAGQCHVYDLAICSDTFCYFGALDEVMAAAHAALVPAGLLVFTVEEAAGEPAPEAGYLLAPHGRYAHTQVYVTHVLERSGFASVEAEAVVLRKEGGAPVGGLVFSARAQAFGAATIGAP